MKRIIGLVVILLFVVMATQVFAEETVIEEAILEKCSVKVANYYVLDEGEWDLVGGFTLIENIYNLPIDIAGIMDGDELLGGMVDISVPVTKNLTIGIGWVFGFDRIENPFTGEMGEYKNGPSVVAKLKF